MPRVFIGDKPIFSSEEYYRKSSIENISGLGLKTLDAKVN
jgi:hypothetical protein